MGDKPNDRLKKIERAGDSPEILASANIKIPDKEMHLMQPDEESPSVGGTCACNSVCTCVPVSSCQCDEVCTCDSVCSTNSCTCHPYSGCSTHSCTCQPVCTCHGHCATCTTCTTCTTGGHYWHPN